MEVKEGYKQTKVGVIPSDWQIKKLGSFADITKLAGFEYSKYFNSYKDTGEIIVVRGTNITHNKLDLSDIKTIPRKTSNFLQRSKLNKGDLVFAYVGTIGPVYLIKEDGKYHLGPNTSKITVNKSISKDFIFSYFKSWLIKNEIIEHTSIGAQPSLSMTKIRNFKILLPSTKAEQTAIAVALSDADALIQSLEKLIAKKRNIKQGAMQELLKPKEGWMVKRLGDFLDYEQPTKYLVTDTEYNDNNDTPVLTAGKTFILGYTNEDFGIYKDNLPVIIFDDFTTATKYVDFPFKAKSSAMKILRKKYETVNLRFIFEIMQRINFPLGDHKRHWISEYQNIEISVPIAYEQTRIATILADMDAEISALETKLAKYKQIKQGMMQELLTGKTRLV